MEAKIGNVTVSKKIFGSVAIFCNQQVVFVDALPTVNIRLNVLYAYNGTLQSWTGLSWVTYTGGSAGTHNDLTGRTAADQHPISAITGLQTVVDKVAGIDAGAQVNVIETVKVNGTPLVPTAKAVNVQIKTINGSAITGTGDITISSGGGLRRSETFYAPSYISYLAFAPTGSLETDAVWTITKRVGSADGTIISNVQYLLKKWTERNLL